MPQSDPYVPYLTFEKISPTETQISILYELLAKRDYGISHKNLPSMAQHQDFVVNHPYRSWYLIWQNKSCIGNLYISPQNTVGLHLDPKESTEFLEDILSYVRANYAPLPEVKSIRSRGFVIHVAPENTALIQALDRLGKKIIQLSYAIE